MTYPRPQYREGQQLLEQVRREYAEIPPSRRIRKRIPRRLVWRLEQALAAVREAEFEDRPQTVTVRSRRVIDLTEIMLYHIVDDMDDRYAAEDRWERMLMTMLEDIGTTLTGAPTIGVGKDRLANTGHTVSVNDTLLSVDSGEVIAMFINETIGPSSVTRARWVVYSPRDPQIRLNIPAYE